jgi:hypothetical protein
MAIDYTWTILFLVAAALACRFSWSTPVRMIGVGLVGSVVFSTIGVMLLPARWIGLEPAIFATAELGVCATAICCITRAPRQAGTIMVLNLVSCIVSLAYPSNPKVSLIVYEEMVNAIFALECFIQINTGLWAYAGHRIGCYFRMRRYRRRAVHALLRFRLASERSERSD